VHGGELTEVAATAAMDASKPATPVVLQPCARTRGKGGLGCRTSSSAGRNEGRVGGGGEGHDGSAHRPFIAGGGKKGVSGPRLDTRREKGRGGVP
jgi:hypothetical protein